MNNTLKIIIRILLIILTLILIIVGIFLVYYHNGIRRAERDGTIPPLAFYTIISPSMFPTLRVNDVILIRRVDNPSDIEVGDIITFISTNENSLGITVTHRVTGISTADGIGFITTGDNNFADDPELVRMENILGRKILRIPQGTRLPFFSN